MTESQINQMRRRIAADEAHSALAALGRAAVEYQSAFTAAMKISDFDRYSRADAELKRAVEAYAKTQIESPAPP